MNKKHFEFVASLIKFANNGTPASVLAAVAADRFTKETPSFDADRFKRACGLTWTQIEEGDRYALASDGTPKVKSMYGLENHSL